MSGEVQRRGKDMDIVAALISAGVGSGAGIAVAVLMRWKLSAISEALYLKRFEQMVKELGTAKDNDLDDTKSSLAELLATVMMLVNLQTEQDRRNEDLTSIFDSIQKRFAQMEAKLNDIRTSQSMLGELLRQQDKKQK